MRRLLVVLMVLVTSVPLARPAPVAAAGQILEWDDGSSFKLFGANEGVFIAHGTIEFACDFIFPTADVYVIQGSPAVGATLSDINGTPNTVFGATGGLFSETIAFTQPSGTLGNGLYTVVYDECQDGKLNVEDAVFVDAFQVLMPSTLPPIDPSIGALKANAGHLAAKMQAALAILTLYERDQALQKAIKCIIGPGECVLSMIVDEITGLIKSLLGLVDPKVAGRDAAVDTISHWKGIKADPPDSAFQQHTTIERVTPIDSETGDPLINAEVALGNAHLNEGALAEALLHALERYQGAQAASDGDWALVHARDIQRFSTLMADQLSDSNAAASGLVHALNADPTDIDLLSTTLAPDRQRIVASGFTLEEEQLLLNLDMTQADVDALRARIAEGTGTVTEASLVTALNDLITANNGAIPVLQTLATDMDAVIADVLADPATAGDFPVADSGGPYDGVEGGAITLIGAGSTSPSAILSYEWDTDGDGAFDDASGPVVSHAFPTAFDGFVGLRVTNAAGLTGTSYAAISVGSANGAPAIQSFTPDDPSPTIITGASEHFTIVASDPDGDAVSTAWLVDGVVQGTGAAFIYNPAGADVGIHLLEAVVSDGHPLGGSTRQTWAAIVMLPDADGDGWHANVDCDDTDASVNFDAPEIAGNGKDDDCDPATSDTPIDADNDGFDTSVDCNDNDPAVNPGVVEVPGNGKDDDCDPATPDFPTSGDPCATQTARPPIGRIVVNHDEWTLSNFGFSFTPDAAQFARNVACWFTGGAPGDFLVYSDNFGLTGSPLAGTMTGAGHTWSVGFVEFSLANLQQYDAIFLAGNAADNAVLIDYVAAGGNVYIAGGTTGHGCEQVTWNTFLHAFGLAYGPCYNGIAGALPITSDHPIFTGVTSLYQNNGNTVLELNPSNPRTAILAFFGSNGLYGVFDSTAIVVNQPPVVSAGADQAGDLGAVVSLAPATFTDADAGDTHIASIDWGDGVTTAGAVSEATGAGSIDGEHLYAAAGTYTVTVAVADDDGNSGSDAFLVTVSAVNRPPDLAGVSDQALAEGTVSVMGVASTDPDGDQVTLTASSLPAFANFTDHGNGTGSLSIAPGLDDANSYPGITVTASDGALTTSASFSITVLDIANRPPVAAAGPDQTVNETDGVILDAGGSSDPDGNPLSLSWQVLLSVGPTITLSSATGANPSFVTTDDGVYVLRLTVADGNGKTNIDDITVVVGNLPPVIASVTNDGPIRVGQDVTIAVTATDPAGDSDPLSYRYDCDGNGAFERVSGVCAFHLDGDHLVGVQVMDDDGGVALGSTTVTVFSNLPPAIDAGADAVTDEGAAFTSAGSFADPNDEDTWTATVDYGDGSGVQPLGLAANKSFALSHVYADNGTYPVTVVVSDDKGGVGQDSLTVIVNNVAPTVGVITIPAEPAAIDTVIAVSAPFTDPGTLDTHTALVEWGDGTISAGVVTEANGSGSVTGSHAYTTPGVYTVTMTVTDNDGGAGEAIYQYIVVYDPNGGFVTGGGWINSPAGAYVADPTLTGKASFGFVAKYKKGQSTPDGNTQFQFQAAGLRFHSTSYEWLVIAGARAQFKGAGTIDGGGNYGFLLTAIDGQLNGGGGTDRFRIKIWDAATGAIVYDNQMNADDDGDATTALGGGSIVIHKP